MDAHCLKGVVAGALLGRQRVGMGQAPADPAAQVLILNLARRDHDGFCRVEHRQSSNGRCLLRPVVSWDAKGTKPFTSKLIL